jgi:hypothetical protein
MPDRHHQQQLLAQHGHAGEGRILDRQGQQREVRAPGAQPPQQALRATGCDLDVDVRMVLLEFLQEQREHIQADGHAAHQIQRARERLLLVGDAGGRIADVVEHPVAELEDRLAGRGDLHPAAKPDEQTLVKLVFEQQNLPADGGLGDVQPGTRPGEGARFRDRPDDFELAKIHGSLRR